MRITLSTKTTSAFQEHCRANNVPEGDVQEFESRLWGSARSQRVGPSLLQQLLPFIEQNESAAVVRGVKGYLAVANGSADPLDTKCSFLEMVPYLMDAVIRKHCPNGWVFCKAPGDVLRPMLYVHGEYWESSDSRDRVKSKARIYFSYHRHGDGRHKDGDEFGFEAGDVYGRTPRQILTRLGLLLETPALVNDYEHALALYQLFKQNQGELYEASLAGRSARLVNDHVHRLGRRSADQLRSRPVSWASDEDREFVEPFWPEIFCFDLGAHKDVQVPVENLTPHVYQRDLKNTLVLPASHHDLVDCLLSDLADVSGLDLIEGKNGGVIILAMGPPGVGKSATAESYAEAIGSPLYRVHAGQLGTTGSECEANLRAICERSHRLGATLLIDECDTYLRNRGDDPDQVALVSSFLRVMEFFEGKMFLTSNRVDIDEAVLSRCLAVVRYEKPGAEDLGKLWKLFLGKHQAQVNAEDVAHLCARFPGIVGRDIKMLCTLALHYATRKSLPLTREVIEKVAIFRGF